MVDVPKGASVTRDKAVNEAGDKLREEKESKSFNEYLKELERAELESIKPTSKDYDVLKDVTDVQLVQLQADKRLVGWNKDRREAIVLKIEFLDKKKKILKSVKKSKGE